MGNVLIYFRPTEFIKRYGLDDADNELLNDVIFRSEEWTHLDDGTMLEGEAVERFNKRLPERLHGICRSLVFKWDQPELMEVPGMEELARDLKAQGMNIYLLSNASSRQHEYWPRIAASRYFDGTLISADVKLVKPGHEIYRTLFSTFSLIPEECIFIDDSEPNIIAARALGMKGIVFDGDAARTRLEITRLTTE